MTEDLGTVVTIPRSNGDKPLPKRGFGECSHRLGDGTWVGCSRTLEGTYR